MSTQTVANRATLNTLRAMKARGEKIACMTAYDSSFTRLIEEAGTEVILVGDSLGMVVQGHDSTIPVSMDDMVYHLQCVSRVSQSALIIGDMPFMSYNSVEQALANAARLMQQGGAHMIKLEGGDTQLGIVKEMTRRGIPVCAHLGLQPQTVYKMGGYKVQGRGDDAAQQMLNEATALVEAGTDMLLLECVPHMLATEIAQQVDVPTIGIGAGAGCDGQILVLQDAIGLNTQHVPRFVRDFSAQQKHPAQALKDYVAAVKAEAFPGAEHCFE